MLKDPALAAQAVSEVVAFVETHTGPLPHPRILAGYDAAVPGSGRDIVNMARDEQKHRHSMERLEHAYPYLGLFLGGAALLACVGGSVFLAMHNKTTVALALMGPPILGAVGLFVRSRLEKVMASAVGADKAPVDRPRTTRGR